MESLPNSEPWCTDQLSQKKKKSYVLNFENIFSVYPIAKVLLSLGKRTMKSTDKKNASYWQHNLTGLQTVLTVILSFLRLWPFDCSLNLFVFTVSRVWHCNRNSLAVYFLKILCYSSWNCKRQYIEWMNLCSSALFFKHTTYFVGIVKNCI